MRGQRQIRPNKWLDHASVDSLCHLSECFGAVRNNRSNDPYTATSEVCDEREIPGQIWL